MEKLAHDAVSFCFAHPWVTLIIIWALATEWSNRAARRAHKQSVRESVIEREGDERLARREEELKKHISMLVEEINKLEEKLEAPEKARKAEQARRIMESEPNQAMWLYKRDLEDGTVK